MPRRHVAALLIALSPVAVVAQAAPRLGVVTFPTSAGPAAQAAFERGVLYLHSFEYESAAEAFQHAQQLEPDFALAYWGEAMTHNHPVWNERDTTAARAVLRRLAPTREGRAAKAKTPREQLWLESAEALWSEGPKPKRDSVYADVMAELADRFPDAESATFHALAILGLSQGERDVPAYMRAGAIALDVFQRAPNHPGAAHYVIHAFDDPDHAILGLPAARAYSRIAPDAGHAQHMTTHIFLALGMWDDVARQNVVAMQAATGNNDSLAWRPGHYTWWLNYARLQQGKWRDANAWLQRQSATMPTDAPLARRRMLQKMADEWQLNVGFFDQIPSGQRTELHNNPFTILAQGVVAWQTGASLALERQTEALIALRDGDPAESMARLLVPQLEALLLETRGKLDSALALLRGAAAHEATLPMDFGPPAVLRPAHEALAELLLIKGRYAEAQVAYDRALARTPGRSRTLAGLALAAQGNGDRAAAARAMTALQVNFHDADEGALERLLENVVRKK